MNETQMFRARMQDLAKRAYQQNTYTYSGFLTPAQLADFDEIRNGINYMDYQTFGGVEICERQMIGFGSEAMFGYEGIWPIAVLLIEPLSMKFAEALSHRDFLGALMNLGIERDVCGDILVRDKRAYLFCEERIAPFIEEHLTKIRHTHVQVKILKQGIAQSDHDLEALEDLKPVLEDLSVIVAAPRFDAIIAAVTKQSRSDVLSHFRAGHVALNGRLCERNALVLKSGDIFSVRGFGKYQFFGEGVVTRKGRVHVFLKKYV